MNGDGAVDLIDVCYLLKNDKNVLTTLETGDFRSQECIELLKEADVVVTNPPFSLFREYVCQLITCIYVTCAAGILHGKIYCLHHDYPISVVQGSVPEAHVYW